MHNIILPVRRTLLYCLITIFITILFVNGVLNYVILASSIISYVYVISFKSKYRWRYLRDISAFIGLVYIILIGREYGIIILGIALLVSYLIYTLANWVLPPEVK